MQLKGDNMWDLKKTNRSAILRSLHENGGTSRKRLSETLALTPATISKIVSDMMEEGLVTAGASLRNGGAGRREVPVELNPTARCALGMFINIGSAVLSAAWLSGEAIFCETVEIPKKAPADETIRGFCRRLLELAEAHGLPRERIIGVGIAIRGITDLQSRIARNTFGALGEEDYPLADAVERLTGLRAVMANNIRALCLAQTFVARDKEKTTQYFLRCEYGIGAALSIDGRILVSRTGRCSEIGHIPVVRQGGALCSCGKRGCLETVASPSAMLEQARAMCSPTETPVLCRLSQQGPVTIHTVMEAARLGDGPVAAMVDRGIELLASALKTVLYTVNPDKVVLYGQLFENRFYLSRFLAEMEVGVDLETGQAVIEKSPYNQTLERSAACILVIEYFLEQGGITE